MRRCARSRPRSPRTPGSRSGRSCSLRRSLTAATAVRGPLATADGALPLGGPGDARWRLLAVSGGRPVSLFGLWNGDTLTPLAAGDGVRTVAL